jgi:hypothetical protein
MFGTDHFLPVINHPELTADYDNLLYACASCNLAKRHQQIPDPLAVLTSANVRVSEDGRLHTENADAACLIEILGLDAEDAVEFRLTWIGIVALAANSDPDLQRKLMGFPTDLPDLERLRPPGGNKRPAGASESWHSRLKRGDLPEIY